MLDLKQISAPDGSLGLNGDDAYIDFDPTESELIRLDGLFSAKELRDICDHMDRVLSNHKGSI